MALPWLLILELVLYAGCFICGIMSAASLTITQASAFFVGQFSTSHLAWSWRAPAISVSVAIYWIYTSCVEEEGKTVAECDSGHVCEDIVLPGGVRMYSDTASCNEADHKTWVSPYDGNQFYTGMYNAEKSVWVNFFWVLIVAVMFFQKHQGLGSGSECSTSETEPFFH